MDRNIVSGLHEPFPDKRLWDGERWPNFSAFELSCKCGGKYCNHTYWHDPEFLDKLQAMRTEIGDVFEISSGHRCHEHNQYIKGALHSKHLKIAADITLHRHDRKKMFEAARKVGFTGIGLAKSFIHVDNREGPLTLWDYGIPSRKAWGISYSPWELVRQ